VLEDQSHSKGRAIPSRKILRNMMQNWPELISRSWVANSTSAGTRASRPIAVVEQFPQPHSTRHPEAWSSFRSS
jgi:hypothetical protein